MTILEFTCLREGFTPSQLGLPDSVLEGAGSKPIEGVRETLQDRMYRAAFSGGIYNADRYRARKQRAKGVTA